jgi:hypothetical protein
MYIQRVETLYLASAVLLPEHEEAASGAHLVAVEFEIKRRAESLKPGNPDKSILCVCRKGKKERVNIGAARRPASHGPEYGRTRSRLAAHGQRSSCPGQSTVYTSNMHYLTLVLTLAASLPKALSFAETSPVVAWSSHRYSNPSQVSLTLLWRPVCSS